MTLTEILTQVAQGKLSVAEAEKLIRKGPPRPPQRSMPLLGKLLFTGIGLLFACVGFGMGINTWFFASSAHETDGTVIRLVQTGNRGGAAPVVRYQVEGETFEFQSGVSSSPPAHTVGENVKILYDPNQPGRGQIRSFVDQWLLPAIFGGLGTVFAVIGIALCLRGMPARPGQGPPPSA